MKELKVTPVYTSVGCNRYANNSNWSSDGIAAYGSGKMISLFNPLSSNGVYQTLIGHKDDVNSLDFIYQGQGADKKTIVILSGSTDGSFIIWKRNSDDTFFLHQMYDQFHNQPITALGVTSGMNSLNSTSQVFATSSVDGCLNIYKSDFSDKLISQIQQFSFGAKYITSIAVSHLVPGNIPVLAIADVSCKIHLYFMDSDNVFKYYLSLTGHENWITKLSFAHLEIVPGQIELFLASSSQDKYIRMYKLSSFNHVSKTIDQHMQLNTQSHLINVNGVTFSIFLSAVLTGHEDWIYSVRWMNPQKNELGNSYQPPALISASTDKSIIIWTFDQDAEAWLSSSRVGEVGGNSFGFYSAMFSPDNSSILAQGYSGGFYLWSMTGDDYEAKHCVSGHISSVQSLSWDVSGDFLVSVGSDQTSRLYAPWLQKDGNVTWHEIARPQIHGYDMQAIAFIAPFKFVSGGDEKVLRVFEPSKTFYRNYSNLSDKDVGEFEKEASVEFANVPALGLSNKSMLDNENPETSNPVAPSIIDTPPTEWYLMTNTLWPEIEKLYGHGFEIFSVSASKCQSYFASSCKSSTEDHSFIIIWDGKTFKPLQRLQGHSLTVTRTSFSPSTSNYLLSVSRDRLVCFYRRNEETKEFELTHKVKAHSRIIWDCAWSADESFFVTASRDKTMKIWEASTCKVMAKVEFDQGVTSVDIYSSYLIAVGLEDGTLVLINYGKDKQLNQVFRERLHGDFISKIEFRKQNDDRILMATSSYDHSVRIFNLKEIKSE